MRYPQQTVESPSMPLGSPGIYPYMPALLTCFSFCMHSSFMNGGHVIQALDNQAWWWCFWNFCKFCCKVKSKVLHLYCPFSIQICSKAHYKYQFTPSGPKAHIGASGSRFNVVHVMLVLILPTSEGWKDEWTSAGKKVTQSSTPDEAGDWTWDLWVGRQRSYHCANPSLIL